MEVKLIKDYTATGEKYDRYLFGHPYSPVTGTVYILKNVELPEYILLRLKEES